jgi:flagellar assembly protein FliH
MAGTSYQRGAFSDPQVIRGEDSSRVERLNLPRVEDLKRTDANPGSVINQVTPDMHQAVSDAESTGYQKGYQAGLAQGAQSQRESVEILQLKLTHLEAIFSKALLELKVAAKDGLKVQESDMAKFSLQVSEEILSYESQLGPARVELAVAKALENVDPKLDVTLRVSPVDFEAVKELFDNSDSNDRGVSVVSDNSVESSGVIVEVGATRIDAQISTAIARVRAVLSDMGVRN